MKDVVMVVDPEFGRSTVEGARQTMASAGLRVELVSSSELRVGEVRAEAVIVPTRCAPALRALAALRESEQANFVLLATMAPCDLASFAELRDLSLDGVALEDENLGSDLLLRIELARSQEPDARTAVERYRQLERECRDLLGLMTFSPAASAAGDADEVLGSMMNLWHGVCAAGYMAYWEWRGGEARWELMAELAAGAMVVKPGREELPSTRDPENASERVRLIEAPEQDAAFLRWAPSWNAAARGAQGRAALVHVATSASARGLLVLGDLATRPTPLLAREAVLRSLGSQLGAALTRAQHHNEVERAYEELKSTQRQLVHAEKFAAMGLLSAEIAHEINNPASFVISNLSVLEDYSSSITEYIEETEKLTLERAPLVALELRALQERLEMKYILGDLKELLERSLAGMQRIHQIVRDLRLMAHEGPHEPGWVQLAQLVDGALTLVRHEGKRRAEIDVRLTDTPAVYTDANRLSQVILNLVINALQSIDPGAPDENRVVIDAVVDEEADRIALRIADTGSGIAPEVLEMIFEPFFTTKQPGTGTGLGLSISRDLVRSLGGELRVQSSPGQGTTMVVELPIRAPKFKKPERMGESGTFELPSSDEIELARQRWRAAAHPEE
ncbi:hypothetical protein FRC98_07910 [Lujinxingia vulgaris]|uniref:histidine kinase n=1 Tax=Lujinxingia vulgaris TaxID=2600176 RepID=A0A5C6XE48_9DELT|nr:ATP-binding protein [Lujinxingia vulgaris]TXD37605.1 hypothetical protein FRC98_07910 [Lujinxingia vulgaris]